ncbi:hypothetical protein [Streptomyces sp. NPDC058157]|uniref:hypothetical protein n=1 Tax=Streptomyces sp. NPDC058157 TaxID=3346360 RepID=UPI0036E79113
MYLRKLAAVLAPAAFCAALIPAPAHAAVGDLTCTLDSAYLTFDPPLKAGHTANVTGYANLTGCVSLTGHNDLTRATITATGLTSAAPGVNPCNLIMEIPVSGQVQWSNGQTSDLDARLSTDPAKPPIGITIDLNSGPLAGDHAAAVVPAPIPNLDCLLNGLQTLTVPAMAIPFA